METVPAITVDPDNVGEAAMSDEKVAELRRTGLAERMTNATGTGPRISDADVMELLLKVYVEELYRHEGPRRSTAGSTPSRSPAPSPGRCAGPP